MANGKCHNNIKIWNDVLTKIFTDGACNIPRSEYPNASVIIPFGISTNDTYEVALNGVDGNYFKLRAWNKVGTWANGEISFGVIIIFK